MSARSGEGKISRPVIIIGAPRSGTTILHACLAMHEEVWHLRAESHAVFEGPFHPSRTGYRSNRLTADDADADTLRWMRDRFAAGAVNLSLVMNRPENVVGAEDRAGRVLAVPRLMHTRLRQRSVKVSIEGMRFVEKTPKNCLRIPLINRLFPDALYVVIQRDPVDNVRSLMSAWRSNEGSSFLRPRFGRYGYPIARQLDLSDYRGRYWKFVLVPEWRSLRGKHVADVAVWQYLQCVRYARQDLSLIPPGRVFYIRQRELVDDAARAVSDVLRWADLPTSEAVSRFTANLPKVNRGSGGGLESNSTVELAAALRPYEAEIERLAQPASGWVSVGGAIGGMRS